MTALKTKERKIFALLLILVLGAVLRFWGLGNNPFVADEFLDINSAYGYFQTGDWKAWDFNNGKSATVNENDARDERANVYKWQVAQVFRFVAPTEAAARSISAIWGVLSVLIMYVVGWKLTGRKTVGLFAAFLFSVSVSGIEFDRRLRMYAMFFPVFLLFSTSTFLLFEREYRGKSKLLRRAWEMTGLDLFYAIPTLLLGIVSAMTHQLTANILPIFGVYVVFMAVSEWKKGNGIRNKYVVTVALGILGAIASFVAVPDKVRFFLGTLVWFDNHYSYLGYVVRDYAQPLFAIVLAAYGAWSLARTFERPREATWLVASFMVPLVMAVWFWRRNEGQQYIFFAQAFLVVLIAAGGYAVVREAKTLLSARWKHSLCVATILLAVLVPNWGYFFQENNTYHRTTSGSSANYRKIFQYFRKNSESGEALVSRNFRNYYWSGMHVPVYDFGGELSTEKLSVSELESLMSKYPTGWVIASDNDMDYVSRDAETFMYRNMDRQSNALIRGNVLVFRWGVDSATK
jgi:4-amino-4-deoxy-L-arabinose transferase-like glycosyltransferase